MPAAAIVACIDGGKCSERSSSHACTQQLWVWRWTAVLHSWNLSTNPPCTAASGGLSITSPMCRCRLPTTAMQCTIQAAARDIAHCASRCRQQALHWQQYHLRMCALASCMAPGRGPPVVIAFTSSSAMTFSVRSCSSPPAVTVHHGASSAPHVLRCFHR